MGWDNKRGWGVSAGTRGGDGMSDECCGGYWAAIEMVYSRADLIHSWDGRLADSWLVSGYKRGRLKKREGGWKRKEYYLIHQQRA